MHHTGVYDGSMRKRTGWIWVALLVVWEGSLFAQTLGNQTLTGKYYFRHVSLGTNGVSATSLTDGRSLIGTITFDGSGKYMFTGQQIIGSGATASATGSGNYTVDAGGFVSIDSPLRSGTKINARYSTEAVLGSSTESGDNNYDLFIAVPAPSGGAVLGGPYAMVSLEFPSGTTANMRNSQFSINTAGLGALQNFSVTGHAVNLGGTSQTQAITGATYTMTADGTGTLSIGSASNTQLVSGSRTLYLSASGNIVLGGSTAAGAHDILIGVKAVTGATDATWNATFWGAGLRVDPSVVQAYSGSVAARGRGKLTWTKRLKVLGFGPLDFTAINGYALSADGTGKSELTTVALGAAGKAFVGASINNSDSGAYEVYFGVQVPSLSGSGVFLNPLGVLNAASFAPPGNPIAPGQFVALFGTGLAASNRTATPPYPAILNGVTVQVNGKASPIYFVSPGQINFLVPFATTGSTASIVVQNNGVNSNTVTVPLGATSPGVYSLDQSGSGAGAILHTDYSLVNASNPAAAGETVLVYLTGMGTVTPNVADGTAGTITTLYKSNADVGVLVAGRAASVAFSGLAPGFPGLYQLNVTLPPALGFSGSLPLVIQTGNAYHDQVDIPIK
jgi:uncharacterized protein (TIGR03437 family)